MSKEAQRAGWSPKEFAAACSLSRTTYYMLAPDKKPASVKVGGRVVIIEPPDAWLRRLATQTNLSKGR